MKKIFAGLIGFAFVALAATLSPSIATAAPVISVATVSPLAEKSDLRHAVGWHYRKYRRHRGYRHRYRYRRVYYGKRSYGRRCGYWRRACIANWAPYPQDVRGCLRYHGCY